MRGFIIMIFVFILLISFVAAEELYVNNASERLSYIVDEKNIKNVSDIVYIIDVWNKEEKILNYFVNQKELEKITLDIKTAKSLYESGNMDLYKAYLLRTKERIKDLPQY